MGPRGPFDGAACLLTLHFLPRDERLHTLREIRRRLLPGAPPVVAHHSYPSGHDPSPWLARSAAFANGPGVDGFETRVSGAKIAALLPLLSIDEEETVLREAGFSDIAIFYAGFSFRGWVSKA